MKQFVFYKVTANTIFTFLTMTDRDTLNEIGSRIKNIRNAKNITQKDLAFMCGFEKASMSRIESGQTNITILTLQRICNSLGVTIKEFFNWQE